MIEDPDGNPILVDQHPIGYADFFALQGEAILNTGNRHNHGWA